MRTLFRDLQPEMQYEMQLDLRKNKTNACLTLLLMPINKTSTELSDDLYYILLTQWADSDLVKNCFYFSLQDTPGLFNYSFGRARFEKMTFVNVKRGVLKCVSSSLFSSFHSVKEKLYLQKCRKNLATFLEVGFQFASCKFPLLKQPVLKCFKEIRVFLWSATDITTECACEQNDQRAIMGFVKGRQLNRSGLNE